MNCDVAISILPAAYDARFANGTCSRLLQTPGVSPVTGESVKFSGPVLPSLFRRRRASFAQSRRPPFPGPRDSA